jgi:hypothetical protein
MLVHLAVGLSLQVVPVLAPVLVDPAAAGELQGQCPLQAAPVEEAR